MRLTCFMHFPRFCRIGSPSPGRGVQMAAASITKNGTIHPENGHVLRLVEISGRRKRGKWQRERKQ